MSNNRILEIKVDNGKYTIYQEESGHVWADRYDDEKWLDVTMTPGSKMILSMAYELEMLRDSLHKEKKANLYLLDLIHKSAWIK